MDESLVDKDARRLAARLLKGFIGGHITNDVFEDAHPVTQDPCIDAIWTGAWPFYSDMKEHKLVGRHRLTASERRIFIRWLLFLDNDFPYRWPDIRDPARDPATRSESRAWKRFLNPNSLRPEEAEAFLSVGHYPVWPFSKVEEYKYALANPRRLSGRASRAA